MPTKLPGRSKPSSDFIPEMPSGKTIQTTSNPTEWIKNRNIRAHRAHPTMELRAHRVAVLPVPKAHQVLGPQVAARVRADFPGLVPVARAPEVFQARVRRDHVPPADRKSVV